jgi:SWI/SNF-related matrix-associated actin-dependent regulator of chromatin subfamily A member 5
MTHKLGYGQWEELKAEVRKAWEFRFDWFIKSRTPVELNRRVDALIRLIVKENQDEKEQKKSSTTTTTTTPSKVCTHRIHSNHTWSVLLT